MKKTALNQTHKDQKAKMVEFAGYEMPVQYPEGMLKEHQWVRSGNVGLFDVSHMGQFFIEGKGVAEFLSKITPTNFTISKDNQAKYTVLTNEEGGIIDDLIITKVSNTRFFIVLNAGCKEKDQAWIESKLPTGIKLDRLDDRSLIAIQGQKSEAILNQMVDGKLSELKYMYLGFYNLKSGEDVIISRCGYTGEDGFEVSIKNKSVAKFWLDLCRNELVKPVGLGARDSLRLEMGYPLYGHDLNDKISPIEAGIGWVVSKNNQEFIGYNRVLSEKQNGSKKLRFGIKLTDRGIAREGTKIIKNGEEIGFLTSGGYSPTIEASIGQGYFDQSKVAINDQVFALVRDRQIPAIICSPTFVEARTKTNK